MRRNRKDGLNPIGIMATAPVRMALQPPPSPHLNTIPRLERFLKEKVLVAIQKVAYLIFRGFAAAWHALARTIGWRAHVEHSAVFSKERSQAEPPSSPVLGAVKQGQPDEALICLPPSLGKSIGWSSRKESYRIETKSCPLSAKERMLLQEWGIYQRSLVGWGLSMAASSQLCVLSKVNPWIVAQAGLEAALLSQIGGCFESSFNTLGGVLKLLGMWTLIKGEPLCSRQLLRWLGKLPADHPYLGHPERLVAFQKLLTQEPETLCDERERRLELDMACERVVTGSAPTLDDLWLVEECLKRGELFKQATAKPDSKWKSRVSLQTIRFTARGLPIARVATWALDGVGSQCHRGFLGQAALLGASGGVAWALPWAHLGSLTQQVVERSGAGSLVESAYPLAHRHLEQILFSCQIAGAIHPFLKAGEELLAKNLSVPPVLTLLLAYGVDRAVGQHERSARSRNEGSSAAASTSIESCALLVAEVATYTLVHYFTSYLDDSLGNITALLAARAVAEKGDALITFGNKAYEFSNKTRAQLVHLAQQKGLSLLAAASSLKEMSWVDRILLSVKGGLDEKEKLEGLEPGHSIEGTDTLEFSSQPQESASPSTCCVVATQVAVVGLSCFLAFAVKPFLPSELPEEFTIATLLSMGSITAGLLERQLRPISDRVSRCAARWLPLRSKGCAGDEEVARQI